MNKPINNIRCTHCGVQQMVESVENGPEGLYCICKECKSKNLLIKVSGKGETPLYRVVQSILCDEKDN